MSDNAEITICSACGWISTKTTPGVVCRVAYVGSNCGGAYNPAPPEVKAAYHFGGWAAGVQVWLGMCK